jgi:hypothetical protein
MSREVQSEMQIDYVGNIMIEYMHEYTVDRWEEEGHGFHQFEDVETKSISIHRVCIDFEGVNIDITSRLTKEEKKDIESQLW